MYIKGACSLFQKGSNVCIAHKFLDYKCIPCQTSRGENNILFFITWACPSHLKVAIHVSVISDQWSMCVSMKNSKHKQTFGGPSLYQDLSVSVFSVNEESPQGAIFQWHWCCQLVSIFLPPYDLSRFFYYTIPQIHTHINKVYKKWDLFKIWRNLAICYQ